MACHIFRQADQRVISWLRLDRIWHHSLLTSHWARRIARAETADQDVIDDSLAAGMLHDVGRLVLATNFPETYRSLVEDASASPEEFLMGERAVLGVDHAEVGAYLMGTWGLRSSIVEAIAYHHTPGECGHRGFSPLTAVHAACALGKSRRGRGTGPDEIDEDTPLDHRYVVATGRADRIGAWKDLEDELPLESGSPDRW
jgi:putative nucleotidyltransferase with HDIG domain